jgi:Flp pilus assembly protein TadD
VSQRRVSFLVLMTSMILTLPAAPQQPPTPFTQDKVLGMVRSGLGDETGAKAIEQRGIDFAPSEDFLQRLKGAGANDAFLAALRAAKRLEPANSKKPINQIQVFALLAGQVPSHRVTLLVEERGIDFDATNNFLQEVRLAGGEEELVGALKNAKVTKPASIDPVLQARQLEVRQHAARGAEFFQNKQNAGAEKEYRAAVQLNPQDSDLHMTLSRALNRQNKVDEGILEAREAIRLNPTNDMAHFSLGAGLGLKHDWDGAIGEEREAIRLNPNNDMAHRNLGSALGEKGESSGAIAEGREALRLNPRDDLTHLFLGGVLAKNRDFDGAIAEYREALRLNPKNDAAHINLGVALANKSDFDGAIVEYREALRLNPKMMLRTSTWAWRLPTRAISTGPSSNIERLSA